MAAAAALCALDQHGVGSEVWVDKACALFEEHGACYLESGALDALMLQKCINRASADKAELEAALEQRRARSIDSSSSSSSSCVDTHEAARLSRCDFAEMVQRDGGRSDMRLRCGSSPLSDACLVKNKAWFPVCHKLCGGGDMTLLYSGFMVAKGTSTASSTASSSNDTGKSKRSGEEGESGGDGDGDQHQRSPPHHQRWHQDGEHCFEHAHCPPHAINVFVPLVDVCSANGGTELRLGSHLLGCGAGRALGNKYYDDDDQDDEEEAAAAAAAAAAGVNRDNRDEAVVKRGSSSISSSSRSSSVKGVTVTPELKAGGCLMFDYRTVHRGRFNFTSCDRVVLYFCFCRPWFADTRNTRSRVRLVEDQEDDGATSLPWVPRRFILSPSLSPSLASSTSSSAAPAPAPPSNTVGAGGSGVFGAGTGDGSSTNSANSGNSGNLVDVEEDTSGDGGGGAGAAYLAGERWLLFEMNVELGGGGGGGDDNGGGMGTLQVFHGDDPDEVAVAFLERHGLPSSDGVAGPLAEAIREQVRLATTATTASSATTAAPPPPPAAELPCLLPREEDQQQQQNRQKKQRK